ncbi:hypothetical protein [Photobacterium sp. 53610]|uniref:hypothetical protein n=1 Tax=Photobacterium sp. 53610 TaxID=3102789 RepID=UPI002ED8F8E1
MNSNGKMIKGKKSEWLIQAGEELAVSKRAQDDAFRAQQKTGKKKASRDGLATNSHIAFSRDSQDN